MKVYKAGYVMDRKDGNPICFSNTYPFVDFEEQPVVSGC